MEISVDNKLYDPYFILDVTKNDKEEFVTKSFKRKAKIWHPDKNRDSTKDTYHLHMFKVVVESYKYIILQKNKTNFKHKNNREEIIVNKSNSIPTKSLNNSGELNVFNTEFEKMKIDTPNEFGYTSERIKDTKEYENFNYKPHQLFDKKQFNPKEFNDAFEFNQTNQTQPDKNLDVGLYYQTTDCFNAYNSGDVGGASVSSYNGVMIIGDTFGQDGIGYYDSNYSDYQHTFRSAKNPTNKLNIPDDFIANSNKENTTLSIEQSRQQIKLQQQTRSINTNNDDNSKYNFQKQEELFLQKQQLQIKDKIKKDKQLILEYRHMYNDQNTIQAALSGNLITSPDYVSENNIDKRFLKTKF